MLQPVNEVLSKFWFRFINYLPDFFGGLAILISGIILSGIAKKISLTIFRFTKLEAIFAKTKLMPKGVIQAWEEVLGELIRWTIVVLFFLPTLEVWGLSRATNVLNQLIFYIPNIIVAVIIGFIGMVMANLVANIVNHSVRALGGVSANILAGVSRSAVIFFTILIILHQLGVAQDLIRILFTGIVAMLALAGGLAFGLGGQGAAKEMLDEIIKKIRS